MVLYAHWTGSSKYDRKRVVALMSAKAGASASKVARRRLRNCSQSRKLNKLKRRNAVSLRIEQAFGGQAGSGGGICCGSLVIWWRPRICQAKR